MSWKGKVSFLRAGGRRRARPLRAASWVVVAAFAAGCGSDARVSSAESDQVSASPYWRHTLSFPNDPFASSDGAGARWVKFSILTSDPTQVYFQDSRHYAFHLDFARKHLPGFAEITPAEFETFALHAAEQKVVLGVVLLPPDPRTMEFGIQLVRQDEFSKEDVKRLHDLVRSKIVVDAGGSAEAFYMPTFEQQPAAQRDRDWLEANDVRLGSSDRWLAGDACYAQGWAFGRAKFIPGGDVGKAFVEGRLAIRDILVTDGVPAEVPPVAGIVSLSPSTPSSHVAILAKTSGIPFVFPKDEAVRARMKALDGKEVAIRTVEKFAMGGGGTCSFDVIEPKGSIDDETRDAIAALKRLAPVAIQPREHLGTLTRKAVDLRPDDVRYFGGKASNFGTLRRSIPENSPNTLGISFNLWEAFVAQTLTTGKTLAEEIGARLDGLTYPPDVVALEAKLEEIRKLVTGAKLPDAARATLLADLQAFGFQPKVKIRFRSSTNVEDGDVLSGAGLYDSYSGCLADELDGDDVGPSACDPEESSERGVERAIKKVFASFFNTNAVLERLKYGIREQDVGMAIAAHLSFPDAREAANGVATITLDGSSDYAEIELTTQLGAESVTNPTGAALPETIVAKRSNGTYAFVRKSGSTRVPAGATVMTWEDDYRKLSELIVAASGAFLRDHAVPADRRMSLDIEYKKDTDGTFVLKQIRRLPEAPSPESTTPVMLNEGMDLCTFQGGGSDILANHRGKMRGSVDVRSMPLSDDAVARGFLSSLDIRVTDDGAIARLEGAPESLLGAQYRFYRHGWTSPSGTFALRAYLLSMDAPLRTGRDGRWFIDRTYATEAPEIDRLGNVSSVTKDSISLEPCAPPGRLDDRVQTIEASGPKGLHVRTQYRFARSSGADVIKTERLGAWESTEIQGLTSTPIVLRGWFSQTFAAGHHNVDESFAFEPGLEEGIAPEILRELDERDIRMLIVQNLQYSGTDQPNARYFVVRKSTQRIEPF